MGVVFTSGGSEGLVWSLDLAGLHDEEEGGGMWHVGMGFSFGEVSAMLCHGGPPPPRVALRGDVRRREAVGDVLLSLFVDVRRSVVFCVCCGC